MWVNLYLTLPLSNEKHLSIVRLASQDGRVEVEGATADDLFLISFVVSGGPYKIHSAIAYWIQAMLFDAQIVRIEYEKDEHKHNKPWFREASSSDYGVAFGLLPDRTVFYEKATDTFWKHTLEGWAKDTDRLPNPPRWNKLESGPRIALESWEEHARATHQPVQEADSGPGAADSPDTGA